MPKGSSFRSKQWAHAQPKHHRATEWDGTITVVPAGKRTLPPYRIEPERGPHEIARPPSKYRSSRGYKTGR